MSAGFQQAAISLCILPIMFIQLTGAVTHMAAMLPSPHNIGESDRQMYTVSACFHDTLSLICKAGSRILVLDDFYGGPASLASHKPSQVDFDWVDVDEIDISEQQKQEIGGTEACRHHVGHCIVTSPADRDLSLVRRYCNGRQSCTDLQVQRRLCNSHLTNYQQVVYTCVPEERIVDICTPMSHVTYGDSVYLTTPNFPDSYPSNVHCTCRLDVEDNVDKMTEFQMPTTISLAAVYFRLKYSIPCKDWLDVAVRGSTWRLCGSGAHEVGDDRHTSGGGGAAVVGHYVDITFHSDAASPGNYVGVWLQFTKTRKATSSTFHLTCGRAVEAADVTPTSRQDKSGLQTAGLTTTVFTVPDVSSPTTTTTTTTQTAVTQSRHASHTAYVTDVTIQPVDTYDIVQTMTTSRPYSTSTSGFIGSNFTRSQVLNSSTNQMKQGSHFNEVRRKTQRTTGIIIGSICIGGLAVFAVVLISLVTFCKRRPSKMLIPLRRETRDDHIQHQLNSLSFYDSVPLYDLPTGRLCYQLQNQTLASPINGGNLILSTANVSTTDTPFYTCRRSFVTPCQNVINFTEHCDNDDDTGHFHHQLNSRLLYQTGSLADRCLRRPSIYYTSRSAALRHAVSASGADYDNLRRRIQRRSSSLFRLRQPVLGRRMRAATATAAAADGDGGHNSNSYQTSHSHSRNALPETVNRGFPFWMNASGAASSTTSTSTSSTANHDDVDSLPVSCQTPAVDSNAVLQTSTSCTAGESLCAPPMSATESSDEMSYSQQLVDKYQNSSQITTTTTTTTKGSDSPQREFWNKQRTIDIVQQNRSTDAISAQFYATVRRDAHYNDGDSEIFTHV